MPWAADHAKFAKIYLSQSLLDVLTFELFVGVRIIPFLPDALMKR